MRTAMKVPITEICSVSTAGRSIRAKKSGDSCGGNIPATNRATFAADWRSKRTPG
jgi:hypothetical protein